MNRYCFLTLVFIQFLCLATNGQPITIEKVTEVKGKLIADIRSLRDFRPDPNFKDIPVRDINGIIWGDQPRPKKPDFPVIDMPQFEAALQQAYTNRPGTGDLQQNAAYEGIGFSSVAPADPSVAVGPNHVIQAINGSSGALYRIWTKSNNSVSADAYLDQLTKYGGLGDPVVLYDQLANRFIMTEFANKRETGSEGLIIAVSKTGDPFGGWWAYFFSTGRVFPDYPKFSVWNNGYYASTNDFTQTYVGSSVYAFDRANMLNGQAATMQTVRFKVNTYSRYFTMCPVLLQGTTVPPTGTGGLFAYMNDNFVSGSQDSVGLLEFNVNWSNSSLSKVSFRTSLLASSFSGGATCTASRGACVPQPGTTVKLESLERRVMNQPIYRNFGSNKEGIVLTHFANVNSVSGIRWYELRKTSGTSSGSWSIYQQSTYAPNDAVHRWLGSIAYNAAGDIALAFNVSASSAVYPGLRYTGRKSADAVNQMTIAETTLKVGSGSATGYSRYGDYNHLVADPNGTDFWVTSMYNTGNYWSTWVSGFSLPTTLTAQASTAAPSTLEEPLLKGIKLYPNPVKHFLQLQYEAETAAVASLTITDISGKLILQKDLSLSPGINQYRFNTEKWISGSYFFTVRQAGHKATLKFEVRQ
jgi:hypothetical protein